MVSIATIIFSNCFSKIYCSSIFPRPVWRFQQNSSPIETKECTGVSVSARLLRATGLKRKREER